MPDVVSSSSETALSPRAQTLLRDADRRLMALAAGDGSRYAMYCLLRATAAAFARTDSFYVGFSRGDGKVIFPYNYDGREYDDPNVNNYAPGGMTEWILTRQRPYWTRMDGGVVLHRGRAFGDKSRRSKEAIAVPLWEDQGSGKRGPVVGFMAMLSYEDDVYSPETIRFLQVLADSLSAALRRGREDAERRQRFGNEAEKAADPNAEPTLADAIEIVNERLGVVRRKAEELRLQLPENDTALQEAALALVQECERGQTEAVELLLRAAGAAANPLRLLSAREQEVAEWMARGLSNKEIGEKLFISELTAKTHCQNIIRKLGAGGRSGVAERVRPFLPALGPPEKGITRKL